MTKKKRHTRAPQFLYDGNRRDATKHAIVYGPEVINAAIARDIYELRMKAGLTQQELADKVGTSKSAISRLEDASYAGHSLSMLKRIAGALNQCVEIRFVPAKCLRTA